MCIERLRKVERKLRDDAPGRAAKRWRELNHKAVRRHLTFNHWLHHEQICRGRNERDRM